MWKKLTFVLVLAILVGLQFVNSLTCYSCDSPNACRNTGTQVCDESAANTTSEWLSSFHSDVPEVKGDDFKCMNLTYFFYSNFSKNREILGCFHRGIPVCSLTLNASHSSTWANNCKTCASDYCNRNPAGSFSQSPYTIMASAMALLLAKLAI